MGKYPIQEKEAPGWPLLPAKGHYMELNLGLFWQTKRLKCAFFMRTKKERFTGVFLG
jgi:hypothetical protein